MGGPGSGRRKGGGGKSSAMQKAIAQRNHAKVGGGVAGRNAPSAATRYAKANKKIRYLKKTGQ